jgi:hypothetical protein
VPCVQHLRQLLYRYRALRKSHSFLSCRRIFSSVSQGFATIDAGWGASP